MNQSHQAPINLQSQVDRQQQQYELDEIKVTTQGLTHELTSMRKLIEDLHISASEKDAEIIRLKMHLGDEKAKSRTTRQGSQVSLHKNQSKEPRSATKPTRLQDSSIEEATPKQSMTS
mmetsp:Transcript_24678/g.30783  ORF Transcript_24678/g.30783 Transcript_24678/m.30783 type:complete len:118 (+) Transcript_24678:1139-1492(+)|eukprot:CAMPEP_0170468284 /NCGR_PEP_ID=MMETSP0123-20130129/11522_1 /TAXON_ID=182087 /ORGANISM="Favella ehrenbergii, Strain Fehren 1" /LENGTH=117 /DNA_ID=CAMNT_0010734815 /DNA_START=1132 /DNA_END=1485 /DNA_ORIENTATION=-